MKKKNIVDVISDSVSSNYPLLTIDCDTENKAAAYALIKLYSKLSYISRISLLFSIQQIKGK